ncbi:MAG: FtsX-like permease family protein, partial [Planctomycetota bacterium]|nr:FtsX-like permease family protein [Planctomycetota bacterium]
GFLALGNARERAPEVGILRTIGLRARDILWVFLGRAAVMGVAGAVLGYLGGIVVGSVWGNVPLSSEDGWALFDPLLLVGVLVLSPLLAVIATWVPALLAAQQDPAVVLRQD